MNNLWRKSFMAGILSVSLAAGAVTPVFAKAAPDGKTNAPSLAGEMGINQNWETWKTEWDAIQNDWTQVSLTPGSDSSQLNFAWYSRKQNSDTEEKNEQPAQEFSSQAEDAFGDSSEAAFTEEGTDTSVDEQSLAAQGTVDADAQEVSDEETTGEDVAPEELNVEENTEFGDMASTGEDFSSEENTDGDIPAFDTESDESRAIAAMVSDILGAEAETNAPKLIIGEGGKAGNDPTFVMKNDVDHVDYSIQSLQSICYESSICHSDKNESSGSVSFSTIVSSISAKPLGSLI